MIIKCEYGTLLDILPGTRGTDNVCCVLYGLERIKGIIRCFRSLNARVLDVRGQMDSKKLLAHGQGGYYLIKKTD
jgi:hypothetical protein